MIETDIATDSHGNKLDGTICRPDSTGRFPIALMLHGTGPLDRDENTKGQRLDVFNTVAARLASVGIASLRYDKRGCGKSTGDYRTAGHFDLVDDAVSWIDFLSHADFCAHDKIFVLGHSEGTLIAPQVSLKRSVVAGLVLLCPVVESIESVLIRQADQLQRETDGLTGFQGAVSRLLTWTMGNAVVNQRQVIAKLKSSRTATLRIGFRKIEAKSLRELLHLDAAAIFAQVTCPMLLIGGEKDVQCEPGDVGRIAALTQGAVESHVVPNLTHILRFDDGPPSFFRCAQLLQKPVEPIVLDLVSEWIARQCRVQSKSMSN